MSPPATPCLMTATGKPTRMGVVAAGFILALILACSGADTKPMGSGPFALSEARAGYSDDFGWETDRSPPAAPPTGVFELVTYTAPLGANAAYITPVQTGPKRPAILWLAGGFDWGIGSSAWEVAPRENDQSAAAFREAGLVLMLPSLRGSNQNPGHNEAFLGEVDDVLAAADYLASRADVDPNRVYLGGHSTGATLALLAVATTTQFRAVFALGPVANPGGYGPELMPPSLSAQAIRLRSPARWSADIRTPTWVIEGDQEPSNVVALRAFQPGRGSAAPVVTVTVKGGDHFTIVRPVSEIIARQILADKGSNSTFSIDNAQLAAATAARAP